MDTSERERDPGPPTVRSRITRSLFGDLVVWQVAFGLLVGIVFPFFAVLIGVRSRIALSAPFFLACLIAGGLVAFVNFWFARALVRRPLELLADRLQAVGGQVRRATAHGDPAHEVTIPRIEVQSQDSIGRVGAAFNELLDAQAHERRFRALLSHASDVVSIFEEDGSPRFHTPSLRAVLGYEPDELKGEALDGVVHPEDLAPVRARLQHLLDDPHRDQVIVQVRVRHADGRWRWLEAVAADLRAEPTVQGLMVTSRDITHRKELEEQLERQAFTDALTGLANRALFMQRLEKALTRVRRHGDPAAVLFIDLDDFKPINDRLGHEVGDRVLVHASERIRSALRESDTPARFGGDEFAVLLEDLGDEDDPQLVARRILEALARPEDGAAWAQPLAASLGVAMARDHTSAETIMRRADLAMYSAKAAGKNQIAAYEPWMHGALRTGHGEAE